MAEQRPTAVFITRRETRRGGGRVKFAQTNAGGEGGVDGLSTAGRVAIPPRLLLQNTLINDSSEQIYLHY